MWAGDPIGKSWDPTMSGSPPLGCCSESLGLGRSGKGDHMALDEANCWPKPPQPDIQTMRVEIGLRRSLEVWREQGHREGREIVLAT